MVDASGIDLFPRSPEEKRLMDENKDKVQALVDLIAKQPLGTTSNGTFGLMCTKPVEYNAGSGHVVKAWDGKTRLSPVEAYLNQARGGLDAVRGDSFHFVAAASLRDGIQLEVEGYVVGKIIGPIFKYGAELLPAAKEAAKTAFKSASEAAKQAGKSASEALSLASKAAGEAAAKAMNAAKKGVAILARKYKPIKGNAPDGLPKATIQKDGWPDLPARESPNFNNANAVELKEGEKIYRIIDDPVKAPGGYWARELPNGKDAWRSDYAVLTKWNKNGLYVEHTVGSSGLKVWEGGAAAQNIGNGTHFAGGGNQIWMPPGTIKTPLTPKPTGW